MYRRITHRFWMSAGAVAALAIGAQAQGPVPNLLDWRAIGGSGAIQSATPFTLKNITDKDEAQKIVGARLFKEYGIRDSAYMTSCFTCHR